MTGQRLRPSIGTQKVSKSFVLDFIQLKLMVSEVWCLIAIVGEMASSQSLIDVERATYIF